MPFTPLHLGPSATVGFIFRKQLDLPVFLLANLAVDLEPLSIEMLGLDMPLHPVCHSLTVGALVGVAWGFIAYRFRRPFQKAMNRIQLSYETDFLKVQVSAILGVWSNVLIDALMYPEIKLLYPFGGNPLYGHFTGNAVTWVCVIFLIPAWMLYRKMRSGK